jgi:hypothetical protein
MAQWKLVESTGGLRMESTEVRAMGEEGFTWAHLLYGKLGNVELGIFYFPSRFDSVVDQSIIEELRKFGRNTGDSISVNVWDPKDPEFEQALTLFGLKTVPAVVLASGLKIAGMEPRGPTKTPLYSIVFDDLALLSNTEHFQNAVNAATNVLSRSNPKEIAGYIRLQKANDILAVIGKTAAKVRDEILRWKPKFGIPGGASVEVG